MIKLRLRQIFRIFQSIIISLIYWKHHAVWFWGRRFSCMWACFVNAIPSRLLIFSRSRSQANLLNCFDVEPFQRRSTFSSFMIYLRDENKCHSSNDLIINRNAILRFYYFHQLEGIIAYKLHWCLTIFIDNCSWNDHVLFKHHMDAVVVTLHEIEINILCWPNHDIIETKLILINFITFSIARRWLWASMIFRSR